MRTWLPILVIFSLFLGVYTWRRAKSQPVPVARAPFPGAQVPEGALLPGSQVTARMIRGGLLVDGDLADPLQEIDAVRVGTPEKPEEKVTFSGGWTSPVRAIWFFDVDPAAKYRVNIRTRHRSMAEVLTPGKTEPLELQRVRVHVKASEGGGKAVVANFSPDGAWLAVGTNAGDLKLVSTPGDQTRIDLHGLGKIARLFFAFDFKTLFVFSNDNEFRTFDIATGKESPEKVAFPKISLTIQTFDANVIGHSDDGRWLVKTGAAAGSMALFDTKLDKPTKPVYAIAHPFAALSSDGRYLAVIDERNLATEPEEADVDVIVEH